MNAIHQYEVVKVMKDLEVDKLKSPHINGLRIEDLQNEVLRLSVAQEIPGPFTFENVIAAGTKRIV